MTESQSSAITKKVLTDWLHVNWSDCNYVYQFRAPCHLYHSGIPYGIEIVSFDDGYLCYPSELKEAVTFGDKKTIAQKIVEPFYEWQNKEQKRIEKKEKAVAKRKLNKKVKKFLAAK
jgi:hypothetical protein